MVQEAELHNFRCKQLMAGEGDKSITLVIPQALFIRVSWSLNIGRTGRPSEGMRERRRLRTELFPYEVLINPRGKSGLWGRQCRGNNVGLPVVTGENVTGRAGAHPCQLAVRASLCTGRQIESGNYSRSRITRYSARPELNVRCVIAYSGGTKFGSFSLASSSCASLAKMTR